MKSILSRVWETGDIYKAKYEGEHCTRHPTCIAACPVLHRISCCHPGQLSVWKEITCAGILHPPFCLQLRWVELPPVSLAMQAGLCKLSILQG